MPSTTLATMPDKTPSRFQQPDAPNAPPATDTGFRARQLPGTPAGEAQGMLPGMAMIALYLLFVSMFTSFQVMRTPGMPTYTRYAILAVSTLVAVGAFGLLRLRRWGWALDTGGCLTMTLGNFYAFHHTHAGPFIIQGLFGLVFFLYLSRPEVRDRLH